MERKRNTKHRILIESLNLFSKEGYDGVSVKKIADAVGIKDSSLYKHYDSKQGIFNALIVEATEHLEKTLWFYALKQSEIEETARQYCENDMELLRDTFKVAFVFWLSDPFARNFRRMLVIEQYKTGRAGKILENYLIEIPLSFYRMLFEQMIKLGSLKNADIDEMTIEFYSAFYLLISQYDGKDQLQSEAVGKLDRHIERFAQLYDFKEPEDEFELLNKLKGDVPGISKPFQGAWR